MGVPPPPRIHPNPVNTDSEGATESVRIKGAGERVEFTENCEGFLFPGTRNAITTTTIFMFIFTVDGVA